MTMILESANTTTWQILSEEGDYTGNTWNLDIDTAGTFTLITNGAIDAFVAWDDGTSEKLTATSGTSNFTHTYSPAGTYTVQLQLLSGDVRPYYNNSAAGNELIVLGNTPAGWGFGATLQTAFKGLGNMTAIGDIDTSGVSNFFQTWHSCFSLTVFPLLDISSGTTFFRAWYFCDSMTTFSANFFDSWAGVPADNCFVQAWSACFALTATSVENILNSIAASGQNAPGTGPDITIDYDAGTGVPYGGTLDGSGRITPEPASITNLRGRGWTVTLNGNIQDL